jgi:hypothetical protein
MVISNPLSPTRAGGRVHRRHWPPHNANDPGRRQRISCPFSLTARKTRFFVLLADAKETKEAQALSGTPAKKRGHASAPVRPTANAKKRV